MSLHEDLGQVNFLFCNKTGTLTQNELVFKKWACGGQVLADGQEVEGLDGDLERFKNLLRCIVVCHDVLMMTLEDKDGVTRRIKSGSSVDEICLLETVEQKQLARFVARDTQTITVEILGELERYNYVKFHEFTSERKMMSVVVKDAQTDQMLVFAKGSDSAIADRQDAQHLQNADFMDYEFANKFAAEGLRTLAFAYREVAEDEVFDGAQQLLESNLALAGVTGVEDLLQEDVVRCISEFRMAGIKVWMLTGDKGETALEIGLLCGMYDKESVTMMEVKDG